MADEFPALEVAAALGALAAGIRSYQLIRSRLKVPRLAAQIEAAMRAGQNAQARELCRDTEASALGNVADALLDSLDSVDPTLEREAQKSELRRVIADALAGARARVQSARARDLLVALVLIGAVFYAARSGLTHNLLFFSLSSLGALLAASGFALRPGLVALVESEADRLLEAGLVALGSTRELGADPCPTCGGSETLIVDTARALGERAVELGLRELRVCRRCGYVQGSVTDPARIQVGAEQGISLSSAPLPEPDEASVEPTEHEG